MIKLSCFVVIVFYISYCIGIITIWQVLFLKILQIPNMLTSKIPLHGYFHVV